MTIVPSSQSYINSKRFVSPSWMKEPSRNSWNLTKPNLREMVVLDRASADVLKHLEICLKEICSKVLLISWTLWIQCLSNNTCRFVDPFNQSIKTLESPKTLISEIPIRVENYSYPHTLINSYLVLVPCPPPNLNEK